MDNNIHINPESIGKFKALSDVPSPEGYESPITGYISQLSQQIIEQRDNEIVAQINEQIGVNVDKNELIRALNYDRNQFNEGYRKGYRDATEKYEEADRWIPVSERLPEEKINQNTHDLKEVQCTTIWGDVRTYKFGKPIGHDTAHFWYGLRIMDEYVVAWKPLSKPYTESEEEE